MTRFQDKTEQDRRQEVRDLIVSYAKSNGDPVPSEDQLEADVDQIMINFSPAPVRGESIPLAWLPDAVIEKRAREILAAHDPAEDDPTTAECRVIMARRDAEQARQPAGGE